MPALNSSDLAPTKKASSGEYAGMSRSEIFEQKIKDKKDFILGSSISGTKVKGIGWDKVKKVFTYEYQNKMHSVPFTKVFKDKDFGGGSGSGGGAADTALTESLQCFYCAYVFNVKKAKCDSVSTEQLEKAEKFAYTDKTLKECLEKGPADWIENDVYIKTANKLWEKYGAAMRANGDVFFHRGSKFMTNLYEAKKICHDIDRQSQTAQAPGSFSADKWNPGDIWATTLDITSKPLHESTSNWGELNAQVYNLAQKGELLGISLKKIGKQSTASVTEFNTPAQQAKRESYLFNGFKYGKTGDFFASQDIYLMTNVGEIQFRTFGGDTSWQGEIKGGSAAGGKIGGGNVDFYLRSVVNKSVYGKFSKEADLIQSIQRSNTIALEIYELYKKHNSASKPSKPLLTRDEFLQLWSQTDSNFINSKVICMYFIDGLLSGTKAKRDDLVTKLFRYAQSDVDQSSFYVKVS